MKVLDTLLHLLGRGDDGQHQDTKQPSTASDSSVLLHHYVHQALPVPVVLTFFRLSH